MIVRALNWLDRIRFRLQQGYWCSHPEAARRSQLIDTGMRKMFWCADCGHTTFT